MATRFRFLDSNQETQAPLGLFEDLFAPGSINVGTFGAPSGTDALIPALRAIEKGAPKIGLSPLDSLFDESGRVLDPDQLLIALNAAEVLTGGPDKSSGAQFKEAIDSVLGGYYPESGPRLYGLPGIGPPPPYRQLSEGNLQADFRGQLLNELSSGLPSALQDWLALVSGGQNDDGGLLYSPDRLRFRGYDFFGTDLRNATRADLESIVRDKFGVDLATFAASPTQLLEARQKFLADPSQIYDPQAGALTVTSIPGLSPLDSAARVDEFSQALERALAAGQNRLSDALKGRLTAAGTSDIGRSTFGQYLLGSAGSTGALLGQAGRQQVLQPDNSFLFQSALNPDLIDQTLSQLRLQY